MSDLKANIFRLSPDDIQVVLVKIEHHLLTQPIGLNNGDCIVKSDGIDYIPCAFSFDIIKDIKGQIPKGKFSVSNVGKKLMKWVEQATGGHGATLTFKAVRLSNPSISDLEPVKMNVEGCNADIDRVSFSLIVQDLYSKRSVPSIFDPEKSKGLF